MSHHLHAEDPEPADRVPAGPLFVPVRPGPAGCTARLFRTPLGGRTAVGFTSPQRLAEVLGGGQPWVRLSESALRALAEPVGATTVTVDPRFTPEAPREPRRTPDAARDPRFTPGVVRTTRDPLIGRDAPREPLFTPDVRREPRLAPGVSRASRSSHLRPAV
ncbi:SAV_915 family protein [Streptomyces noursei]|uniref:SAV_915 family protein n=1 Tax=Streptomyces noursei TaxID=1971 RepID=UPI0015E0EC9A|nr:SAV_915 family protein [Streptomyces noursei]